MNSECENLINNTLCNNRVSRESWSQ